MLEVRILQCFEYVCMSRVRNSPRRGVTTEGTAANDTGRAACELSTYRKKFCMKTYGIRRYWESDCKASVT
jgi:hypothetical protein